MGDLVDHGLAGRMPNVLERDESALGDFLRERRDRAAVSREKVIPPLSCSGRCYEVTAACG